MSAHQVLAQLANADWHINDPGASGTITVLRSGTCELVSAGAESRTLAAPTKSDLEIAIVGKTIGGTVTVTIGSSGYYTESNDTNFTITAAGQFVLLRSFEIAAGTFAWRLIASDTTERLTLVAAANASVADAAAYFEATNVETVLAEIGAYLTAATWACIPMPLNCWRETSNLDVGDTAANGGVLASDTTPVLDAINAATDGCQRLLWAAGNADQITQSVIIPPDLDADQPIVFHCRIASGGTTNAVGFTLASYFNEGDTAVADTTATNQTTGYLEKTATIAAADIGVNIGNGTAGTLTIGLTPAAHATDTMACTATWLTYTRKLQQDL